MKLSDRFLKNRVKPIVIAQFVLIIPMIVLVLLSFKTYPVNFYYSGFIGIILAISMFLTGIEQYILKKKKFSIAFFTLTLLIILVVIQTFYFASIKR